MLLTCSSVGSRAVVRRPQARALPLLCALLVVTPVGAEAIYKSVDADGRVSYSTQPTSQGREPAVELRIRTRPEPVPPGGAGQPKTPGPPPAPARGASQGADQGARQATRPGTDRASGQRPSQAVRSQSKRRVQDAQLALIQAKAELEQAKIQGPEDWQTTPSGDRVPTLAYDQRVTAAQAKVRAAETALERSRKP